MSRKQSLTSGRAGLGLRLLPKYPGHEAAYLIGASARYEGAEHGKVQVHPGRDLPSRDRHAGTRRQLPDLVHRKRLGPGGRHDRGASDNGWEVGVEIIFVTLVMVYLAARSVLAATGAMRHMSHYKAYTALTAFATLVIFFRIGTYPKPAGVTTSLGVGDFVGLLAAVAATVVCFLAATHKGIGRVAPTESEPSSAGRGSN